MKKTMVWLDRNRVIFVSFAMAFGIMLILLIMFGAYPFGPYHMLQIDASQEYAPRLIELFQKIKSGESLFYSWRGGLGNDFYFAFLTTMLNPFIYIGLLLAPTSITDVFTFMYLFQIPCCALTFAFFLKEKYNGKSRTIVMFSLMYAFSSYVTGYFWVYYWLTGVMLLPLVAVGVDRVLQRGKLTMYALSLGFGIISNYMMGLFLCLFSVLYFLGQIIMGDGMKDLFTAKLKTRLIPYAAGSLLGGGLAAFVLIPILISLPNTSFLLSGAQPLSNQLRIYFSALSFLTAHYFKMKPAFVEGGTGLPNVYMSLLGFICAVFYFVNPKFSRKQKIVHGSILLLLYLLFSVESLDYMIHGFHFTSGAPHRFAFVYVFFLLYPAYESFQNLDALSTRRFTISYFIFVLISLYLFYRYPMIRALKPGVFSADTITLNVFLLVLYLVPFYLRQKQSKAKGKKDAARFAPALFMILVGVELVANTFGNLNYYKEVPERDRYALELYNDIQVLKTQTEPELFFRSEQIPDRVFSDGKMFDYNGVSIFSITYNPVVDLLKKFGIVSSVNKVEYRLGTPLLNSIFSVRYSFNRAYMQPYPPTYFTEKAVSNSVTLMENPYALPIGFMVDEKLLTWQAEELPNPFAFQNQFIQNSAAVAEPLFSEPIPIEKITEQKLTYSETAPFSYEYKLGEDAQPEDDPTIEFSFAVREAGDYFLHLYGTEIKNYFVKLEGDRMVDLSRGMTDNAADTFDINNVPAGSTLQVKLQINNRLSEKDPDDFVADYSGPSGLMNQFLRLLQGNRHPIYRTRQEGRFNIYLTKIDPAVYQRTYDKLADETLKLTAFDETGMKGGISANRDGLLFTSIPFDTRWHIYADGQEQEKLRVLNALLGAKLSQGAHEVELKYIPQGIGLSAALSFGSLAIIILLTILRAR